MKKKNLCNNCEYYFCRKWNNGIVDFEDAMCLKSGKEIKLMTYTTECNWHEKEA